MSRLLSRPAFLAFIWAIVSTGVLAQESSRPNTQERFRYSFSNFVWWTDLELRLALKSRLPELNEDLARNSQIEALVQAELTKLLSEKGIQAQVQVFEPPPDVSLQKRDPEAPAPAIIFSVVSPPTILVEKLVVQDQPAEIAGMVADMAQELVGKPYSSVGLWRDKQKIRQELDRAGYVAATSTIVPGPPKEQGDHYVVPLNAIITSGPKYHVSSIKADGGPLLAGKDLTPYLPIKTGDIATSNPFGKLIISLRTVYMHAGYPDVEFSALPVLDPAHGLASYQLTVAPGPLYHLRSLKIENLDNDLQGWARGMLGLQPEDIYDALALAELSRKLRETDSPLRDFTFTYRQKRDTLDHVVDLTLTFYKP